VTDSALLDAARAARERAYAPYSHFAVGAALLCEDGTVVSAANVENASYGLSMCAERGAIFAAVAGGRLRFAALAVAGPAGATAAPCGACRQVLAEFGAEVRVLYATASGHAATTLTALLPETFSLP
jgi:cytidine deaminase